MSDNANVRTGRYRHYKGNEYTVIGTARHSETLEEHVVYRQEYTSQQTETFEDAMRIIEYYEKRWLIEEYHKSLKTGCQLEARQYETSERLEAIAGFLSIVAVRLLQLKSVARTEPSQQAKDLLPWHWIEVLQTLRKRPRQFWTVRQFFRELAGLGGFLGRKGDGEPGWFTIWRGFDKLVPTLAYAENRHRCG
jgi:hypothetical protein